MRGKRGLSPVIAALLVIMLTVTAVVIIATFLIPFVEDNLNDSTECLPYSGYFTFEEVFEFSDEDFRYNCYDLSDLHGVSVRAGNIDEDKEKEIDGFDLLFVREGSSEKVSVRVSGAESCDAGGIRMLGSDCNIPGSLGGLEIPGSRGIRTYVYQGSERFDGRVEVYPVLDSDGSERVCEMSDSIKLKLCNPEDLLGAT